jgi:steroid delta-isomerase-like uncharacterized protein
MADTMKPEECDRLIHAHIAAEIAGDSAGCVAMYTEDMEHDVVGVPTGPLQGKAAAKIRYDQLVGDIRTEQMVPKRRYFGDDFCVAEHLWIGTVPGMFLGLPGGGRRISFRLLHVWEFKDGLMSRENVWLDSGDIIQQLTSPQRPCDH